jgi:nucleoside-diphosphate-sugar epimerase
MQYNPIKTIKTSVMGTINMLGLAKRVRARILLASTSEVYGDPDVHPQVMISLDFGYHPHTLTLSVKLLPLFALK